MAVYVFRRPFRRPQRRLWVGTVTAAAPAGFAHSHGYII